MISVSLARQTNRSAIATERGTVITTVREYGRLSGFRSVRASRTEREYRVEAPPEHLYVYLQHVVNAFGAGLEGGNGGGNFPPVLRGV